MIAEDRNRKIYYYVMAIIPQDLRLNVVNAECFLLSRLGKKADKGFEFNEFVIYHKDLKELRTTVTVFLRGSIRTIKTL